MRARRNLSRDLVMPEKPKVYTFHGHVPQLSIEDETRLILLWKQAWEKNGYQPIVLNEFMTMQHPLYAALKEKVQHHLPSVNPWPYEWLCYCRWLAMTQVRGGLMSDYDVMPYNWRHTRQPGNGHNIVGFQRHVPSLVQGSGIAYNKVIQAFLDYQMTPEDMEQGRPHISDMLIILKANVERTERHEVKNFGEEGWEKSELVHFSTSSMSANFLPRWKHIPLLRNPL